ncbi:MAG: PD-(D/E)XK nuclease family transposase [Roseburia sp.]|nr:PD-(D/E)XK nuclease family transposase [Roseburia sp.]MCM1098748.1 PD-(D/E)XK nuclease family transposase [Ruminococcus flavefaciens]
MERMRKKYEELTIVDDFMFGKVMRNPKHCKKLLEIILNVKIGKIEFIDDQQTVDPDYMARGIRIDVYVEDDADTVYSVEMQARSTGELPTRSRYYQSAAAKQHKEWRREYMTLERMMMDSKREGRAEGKIEDILQLLGELGELTDI